MTGYSQRKRTKKKTKIGGSVTSQTSTETIKTQNPPVKRRREETSVNNDTINDVYETGTSSSQLNSDVQHQPEKSLRASGIVARWTLDTTQKFLRTLQLAQTATCSRFSPILGKDGTIIERTMINAKTTPDKKIILQKLQETGSSFFTFTDSDDKPSTYVLKGFIRVEPSELKTILTDMGLPLLNVSFLNNSPSYPSYVVSFQRLQIDLFKLQNQYKVIDCVRVNWQRFDRSKKNVTQCHKCQEFGHTAKNCMQPHRCVKCL